jgi:hypothetical protein
MKLGRMRYGGCAFLRYRHLELRMEMEKLPPERQEEIWDIANLDYEEYLKKKLKDPDPLTREVAQEELRRLKEG